jgi:hypothetical protein
MQGLEYQLSLGARGRPASGPGSPSGQPVWGGGCDRLHSTYRKLSEGAVIRSLPLAVLPPGPAKVGALEPDIVPTYLLLGTK